MAVEIVPQWAVAQSFRDGAAFSESYVRKKFSQIGGAYSISEKMLIEDFIFTVFNSDYMEKRGAALDECIEHWCFERSAATSTSE